MTGISDLSPILKEIICLSIYWREAFNTVDNGLYKGASTFFNFSKKLKVLMESSSSEVELEEAFVRGISCSLDGCPHTYRYRQFGSDTQQRQDGNGDFGIYCRCDVVDSFSRMNLFMLLSLSQRHTLVQGIC